MKYTLDPWVVRWEQALQKALLLPQEKNEYFIKLNVDGLLRGGLCQPNEWVCCRPAEWMAVSK